MIQMEIRHLKRPSKLKNYTCFYQYERLPFNNDSTTEFLNYELPIKGVELYRIKETMC